MVICPSIGWWARQQIGWPTPLAHARRRDGCGQTSWAASGARHRSRPPRCSGTSSPCGPPTSPPHDRPLRHRHHRRRCRVDQCLAWPHHVQAPRATARSWLRLRAWRQAHRRVAPMHPGLRLQARGCRRVQSERHSTHVRAWRGTRHLGVASRGSNSRGHWRDETFWVRARAASLLDGGHSRAPNQADSLRDGFRARGSKSVRQRKARTGRGRFAPHRCIE